MSMYVYDALRQEATALLTATGLVDAAEITLAVPKNPIADLAFPVFAAAKARGAGNPNEFAQRLAAAVTLREDALIGKAEASGGFVNFSVTPGIFAARAISETLAQGDAYGQSLNIGEGQRLIMEYSSPNIARKMHVGHLRSTVIGHSLHKIYDALGYDVIADNHLGDWGTQFGTLLAALDEGQLTPWDDPDPVQSLVEIYAKFNNRARENPELMDAARLWFKKLEDGDAWARETWQRLIDLTMVEFDRTYQRLDVHFDTTHGESYFEPMLNGVVQEAIDKGVAAYEPGGAVVVDFGDKLPSCLLRKTDGGTLYQTRDAATCIHRWQTYGPNLARNVYVVGAEQKLHFQQVFEIVRRMGYTQIADCSVHIPFGQLTDAAGQRFSMRKGTAVFLDEVLDEAIERAETLLREKIAEGKSDLTEAEIPSVREMAGIGGVIYADLYQGPDRNIKFDWDKVMSWDGNTSLYIQYMHARCRSILRRASGFGLRVSGEVGVNSSDSDFSSEARSPKPEARLLLEPEEQAVVKQLSRLPHAVREAGEKFLPATVAEWTYNLAREFARFYEKHKVLEAATPELREARLALVAAVAQGLKNGLALLGIKAPEKM